MKSEIHVFDYDGSPSGLAQALSERMRWHALPLCEVLSTSESMTMKQVGPNSFVPFLHYTILYKLGNDS